MFGRKQEEESVIYSDRRVRVTDKRIIIDGGTYPNRYRISDIVFVSKSIRPPKRITGILVILLGLAILGTLPVCFPLIESVIASPKGTVLVAGTAMGIIALAIGIWDVLTVKPAYAVMLSTRNGGVEEVLASRDEAYVERIVDVIKRAYTEYGSTAFNRG